MILYLLDLLDLQPLQPQSHILPTGNVRLVLLSGLRTTSHMALAKSILPDLEVGQSAFSAEAMLLIWVERHWNSKITILKWMNEMRHRDS